MRSSLIASALISLLAVPLIAQTCPTRPPDAQVVVFQGATSDCYFHMQYSPQLEPCVPAETITFQLVPFSGPGQPLEACDNVKWNFGDGSPEVNVTGPNMKVTHKYAKGGYYGGRVTVQNSKGSYYDDISIDVADTVSFAAATLNVIESDGVAHVGLVRTLGSTSSLTVTCYTNDGTAKDGVRYHSTNHSVTFPAGVATATFDVPLIDDSVFIGTQAFLAGMLQPASGTHYLVGTQDRTNVNIADDEAPPVLSFSASNYLAAENSGSATITVNRAGLRTQAVSVHYATRDTNSPAVVTPVSATLNFDVNEVSKTFNIPIVDNDLPSGDKQLSIDLTSPSGATLSGGVGTLTATLKITDDDPLPSVSIDDISVSEGDAGQKNATFHLTLTPPVKGSTPVNYTLGEETARMAQDFDAGAGSGTIVFAPGETSKTLAVPIIGDTSAEADETFHVTISSALASVTRSRGVCTIVNDDAGISPAAVEMSRGSKRSLTIKLPQPAAAGASIPLESTASQIATVPAHVTVNAGASSASFTVTATAAGRTSIRATLPDSLGGRVITASVTVNESPSVSFDPDPLTIAPGATATESLSIDPAMTSDAVVALTVDDPTVISAPAFVTIPARASAMIPITGLHAGTATLTATLNGATDTLAVTVAGRPVITTISPVSGPSAGGTEVTIHGQDFSAACTVAFGARPAASSAFVDAATLTAVTPPHDGGITSVTVTCGSASATSNDAFTFVPGRRRSMR